MNHSPYIDWLYEDAQDLSSTQAGDLRHHLQECDDCRQRAAALRQVESVLNMQTMAAPAAGFAQRWQARLQAERERAHRFQTRLVLCLSLSALVTTLGMLALLAWPYLSSLEAALWVFAYQFVWLVALLAGIGEFASSFLQAMAGVIPAFGWLFAIGMVFELGVLWVVSYRLLTNPRRLGNR
jgi:anti-sigma factor RsiW